MAIRKMKLGEWFKACRKNALGDGFLDLTGPPPASVAETLEVHRSRVYQLIENDSLDALSIVAPNGTITITLVTENSLNRYLKTRAPARRNPDGFTLLDAEKAS
jgi:hypothetical protein